MKGLLVRTHARLIAAAVTLLVATIVLSALVKVHPGPLPGDISLTLAWQHLILPHPWLVASLKFVSTINWPRPAAITATAITVAFALWRRWLDILVSLGTLLLGSSANYLISHLVQRPRPSGHTIFIDQQITDFYSFPSGHVQHTITFFGIVLFLIWADMSTSALALARAHRAGIADYLDAPVADTPGRALAKRCPGRRP